MERKAACQPVGAINGTLPFVLTSGGKVPVGEPQIDTRVSALTLRYRNRPCRLYRVDRRSILISTVVPLENAISQQFNTNAL